MLVDTHCHLYKEYYDDINEVNNNADSNMVKIMISAADNINSCYEMLELSKKFNNIYICLGIHPENVDDSVQELKNILEENKNNKKIVAIGEIGLDYYYGKNNKDKQIELFRKQLSLAEEYNLPVIIHSREATLDTINILKEYNVIGTIHCFSGSLETAKEYIKMGFYIGVGGVMTFKNSKIDNVIKEIPLEKILLETDSPYLAPVPFRGEKNEPKYIKNIAEYLAKIKNISVEKVAEQTTKNAKNLFDL